jgi:hypothetical protein
MVKATNHIMVSSSKNENKIISRNMLSWIWSERTEKKATKNLKGFCNWDSIHEYIRHDAVTWLLHAVLLFVFTPNSDLRYKFLFYSHDVRLYQLRHHQV